MAITIEALDTLFFRDGRPFAVGEEGYWADGVFPPAPSVVHGALRSVIYAHRIGNPQVKWQKGDPTGYLNLKGVFLEQNGTLYFPVPLDCVKEKDDQKNSLYPLSLMKNNIVSSAPTSFLLAPGENLRTQLNSEMPTIEQIDHAFIDYFTLQDYLNAREGNFYYQKADSFFMDEPKIGIAIDDTTGTSEDAMLYRIDLKRLVNNTKLVADYEGLRPGELPSDGLAKLGGEGKGVAYTEVELPPIKPPLLKDRRFKLYLATPAIFYKGWLPKWIANEKTLTGVCEGIQLRLLTATIGRYQATGGFGMNTRKAKEMNRAVPAGSIYYFEILSDHDPELIIKVFHNKNISDKLAKQGFGLAYVGGVT